MSHVTPPEFFDYQITGIDAYANVLSEARVEVTQLLPGELRGHHTRIRVPAGELSWISTSLPLRGRGVLPGNRWTLSVVTHATGRSLQNGAQVRAGSLVVHQPGAIHEGVYGRDFSVVCIGIGVARFRRFFGREGSPSRSRARVWRAYQASGSSRAELIQQFDAAAHTLRHDAAFRRSAAAVEAMLDDLTAGFASALGKATLSEEQPALRDGAALVCRVEAALMADRDHLLRVDELSRATGVPTRSLNRAFHMVLGIGPATYLRRHRLSEARRALLHEPPECATVAEVALRYGFRHLGRFSAQYRTLFNELPHVTLSGPGRGRQPHTAA